MGRRAASRLASLGFTNVFAYPGAKAEWMAFGLPIEGDHADTPTAGSVARRDVPTCNLTDTVGDIRQRLAGTDWDSCIVVNEQRVVLGRVRVRTLTGDDTRRAEEVMSEGPTTIRPDTELPDLVKRMRDRHVASIIVTNPDGMLLGILRREDAEQHLPSADG